MNVLIVIGGSVLGIIFFILINQLFDIYYFGFKGIIATLSGCWMAGAIITLLFGFLFKWIVIIGVVLLILGKIFGNATEEEEEAQETE